MQEHPHHDDNENEQHHSMGERGATRPEHHHDDEMTEEHRRKMLHEYHAKTQWLYWVVIILGFWMMLSPATFGYGDATVDPAGGRDLWLSLQARIATMTISDLVAGALLVFFGWRSLTPERPVSQWTICFIGIWLSLAPVVFWAPTAAAYYNSTFVGALLVALTVLIPTMPNMMMYMKMGPPVPPGWSYNPSSWPQRWIMIATGFAGWMVSRYLAAYQMGYISTVWDPFFGDQTRKVLESDMSEMWPVSDAAFGALAYTFEFLMGFMGSPARWRTMPWMVTIFGILVIPLGMVHIILVISQPVVVGQWCTLCLLAAAIMLPMIPLEVDEVIAMCQHVRQRVRAGEPFWHVFWKGGDPEGSQKDERTPSMSEFGSHPVKLLRASIWGMSFPWTLVLSALLGILLMFVPDWLQVTKPASAIFHLAGALIVVWAIIAMGECIRTVRWLNLLFGALVAFGPWLAGGSNLTANLTGLIAGAAVVALTIPRGKVRESFGTWDKLVR